MESTVTPRQRANGRVVRLCPRRVVVLCALLPVARRGHVPAHPLLGQLPPVGSADPVRQQAVNTAEMRRRSTRTAPRRRAPAGGRSPRRAPPRARSPPGATSRRPSRRRPPREALRDGAPQARASWSRSCSGRREPGHTEPVHQTGGSTGPSSRRRRGAAQPPKPGRSGADPPPSRGPASRPRAPGQARYLRRRAVEHRAASSLLRSSERFGRARPSVSTPAFRPARPARPAGARRVRLRRAHEDESAVHADVAQPVQGAHLRLGPEDGHRDRLAARLRRSLLQLGDAPAQDLRAFHPVGHPLVAVGHDAVEHLLAQPPTSTGGCGLVHAASATTRSGRSPRGRRGTPPRPRPDRLHRLHSLAHQRRSAGGIGAVVTHLLSVPARADPEQEAAARQPVEGGHLLGGGDRVALDHEADAGAELAAARSPPRPSRGPRTGRGCGCTRGGSSPPPGHGVSRLTGMWVCSAKKSDSNPRSSASRPGGRGRST